ncbi:hypothetical protein LENED_007061 [Lentinula edodes]|uniref:Uncharacterized protein n=1 Tax=Lentinula edodes TaxID=5353 RepID=A0A1Q3EDD3_LENED|nr:hypothetical protein LENED_007061 [Lentinula edodes]
MALDPANSDDKWFGVAASELYKLNSAYATSGEEGSEHHTYSCPQSAFSSLGDDDIHRAPPPVELSPSVALEDFVELPPHIASMAPASRLLHVPLRGPFHDPASAPVPEFSNSGHGLKSKSTAMLLLSHEAALTSLPRDLMLGPAPMNPLLARILGHIFIAPLAPSLWLLIMPQLVLTAPPSSRASIVTIHLMTCITCSPLPMHRTYVPQSIKYR